MKVLSLNCQKGYNPNLPSFLDQMLSEEKYDFILLQEVTEKVSKNIEKEGTYKSLVTEHPVIKGQSLLRILYKQEYELIDQEFFSLEGYHPAMTSKLEFGLLLGTFMNKDTKICMGTIHLHAGLRARVRNNEMMYLKGKLLQKEKDCATIFGGDCNFGPLELKRAFKQMSPEFSCPTLTIGPTLDSRFTEPAPSISNKVAVLLAKFGLKISLKTDNFFINQKASRTWSNISAKVLPDRVSDHSPLELKLD